MTHGIIGKGTGRHQRKRLSTLQEPDLKFSANFTNSRIRKRVEAFQLKYNATSRSLHRYERMVWQTETLGLRMFVWRPQLHSHFLGSSCFGQGCVSAQASCAPCPTRAQLSVNWQQQQCTHLLLLLEQGPVPGHSRALGTLTLTCPCVSNFLLTTPKQHWENTQTAPQAWRK